MGFLGRDFRGTLAVLVLGMATVPCWQSFDGVLSMPVAVADEVTTAEDAMIIRDGSEPIFEAGYELGVDYIPLPASPTLAAELAAEAQVGGTFGGPLNGTYARYEVEIGRDGLERAIRVLDDHTTAGEQLVAALALLFVGMTHELTVSAGHVDLLVVDHHGVVEAALDARARNPRLHGLDQGG